MYFISSFCADTGNDLPFVRNGGLVIVYGIQKMKRKTKKQAWLSAIVAVIAAAILLCGIYLLYRFNYIPHRKYTNEDFGIPRYVSGNDQDGDGVDDQTDILDSVYEYLDTKPKYKSKYYAETGYPNDEYGVCTDVVANGMKGAGYDLMLLVNEDILEHPEDYAVGEPDIYIDFRRVKNLNIYFEHTAISLTTDVDETEEWQAGDIVIWSGHIGVISEHRNRKGIPFVLHHANPVQASYEEDILETWGTVRGHYRVSA